MGCGAGWLETEVRVGEKGWGGTEDGVVVGEGEEAVEREERRDVMCRDSEGRPKTCGRAVGSRLGMVKHRLDRQGQGPIPTNRQRISGSVVFVDDSIAQASEGSDTLLTGAYFATIPYRSSDGIVSTHAES